MAHRSDVNVIARRLRQTFETGAAIARDARESRFRQRLTRATLDTLPEWNLTDEQRAQGEAFLAQFSPRYRDLDWHRVLASIRGEFEADCVSEELLFIAIEPELNARDREIVVSEKNGYDRLGLPIRLPETVARVVRGRLVGPDYRPLTMDELVTSAGADSATEVVVKPTAGDGGGTGVQFAAPSELPRLIEPLLERQSVYDDWLIQRRVQQCEEIAALNASSVNTLRIMTYRSSRGVVHISSVLRIGRAGSRLDNQRIGGVTCGIDDGELRPLAHIRYEAVRCHPDSHVRFAGYRVPAWQEAVDACIASHEVIPTMDLISWDIVIDDRYRPTMIEFNTHQQGLQLHEIENGPLPPEIVAEWAARTSFRVLGGLVIRKRRRN